MKGILATTRPTGDDDPVTYSVCCLWIRIWTDMAEGGSRGNG